MPALAIVTLPCSMASCMATLSMSDILSNSSMHTIPRSPRTMAPADNVLSPLSLSTVTAAVRPTPLDPRPVVLSANGAMFRTNRSSWDLAVEGSPTKRMFMSPRIRVCSSFRSSPPSSIKRIACFSCSKPKMEGAIPSAKKRSNSGGDLALTSLAILDRSWVVRVGSFNFLPKWMTLLPTKTVWNLILWSSPLDGCPLLVYAWYTPQILTRSPGFTLSTKSSSSRTSTDRGSCPTGADSGISCSVTV
mmetsp:Transcript_10812/g.19231  ORF Transcript_10812/g.19231 Transcript_10812/m.19231 type:complete len:247 (-) Transcript_10812:659-1399(-)